MTRPERAAALLFALRAGDLLPQQRAEDARARLSGILLGLELAGAKPYWLGQEVVVVGAPALRARYLRALAHVGLDAAELDGETAVLRGLTQAALSLALIRDPAPAP